MSSKDYYKILGIKSNAAESDIKKAYASFIIIILRVLDNS